MSQKARCTNEEIMEMGGGRLLASRTPGWNQWTDLGEVSGLCPSSLSTILAVAKLGNKKIKKNITSKIVLEFRNPIGFRNPFGPKKTGFDKSLVLFSITHSVPLAFTSFLLFLQYLHCFPEQLIPAEVLIIDFSFWGIFILM